MQKYRFFLNYILLTRVIIIFVVNIPNLRAIDKNYILLRTSTGNLIKKNQGTDELKWMFWFSSGTLNVTKNCFTKVWNLLIFFAVVYGVSYSTQELANQNA